MDIYDSVDDMWSFVSSILHECLDVFAPVCSVQSRKSHRPTPWLTPSLLSAIKQKKQAKRKAQQTNSDEDVLLYCHCVAPVAQKTVKELICENIFLAIEIHYIAARSLYSC